MAEVLQPIPGNTKKKSSELKTEDIVLNAISDGKITKEEADDILERFKCERENLENNYNSCKIDISKETASKLLKLANESGFTQIVDRLKEKGITNEKLEETSFGYFGIKPEEFRQVQDTFEKYSFDFDFKSFLDGYKNYIEKNISGLDKSVVEKIKLSIKIKFLQITKILEERIAFVDKQISKGNYKSSDRENEIKNQRWIINTKLQENFSALNNSVLPSALLLIRYSQNSNSIKNPDDGVVSPTGEKKYHIRHQIQEIKNMFETSKVDNKGDFAGDYFNDAVFDNTRPYDSRLGETNNIVINELPSILNEQDKEIEAKAQMAYMAGLVAMAGIDGLAFTGVGSGFSAVVGGGYSAIDVFTTEDFLLTMIKETGYIPDEYKTEKLWYDNALAALGIVPLAGQALKFGKNSPKIAKFLSKLSPEKLALFNKMSSQISEKINKKFSEFFEKSKNKGLEILGKSKKLEKLGEISYEVKKGVIIIHDFDVSSLSKEQVNEKILSMIKKASDDFGEIKSIDFSKKMSPELQRSLNEIISSNYPALSIERLIPGQQVVDLSFSGVKGINDYISKEFCDLLVEKLKVVIRGNFEQANLSEHSRVVRSDYKHFTFSLPDGVDFKNILFKGFSSRKDFLISIFNSISDNELLEIFKTIKAENKAKLGLSESSNIQDIRKILSKKVSEGFDFGIGKSSVPKGSQSFEDKLISFYESEAGAKRVNKLDNFDAESFSISKVEGYAENIKRIRNEIIAKFDGIEVNGHKVIVTDIEGKKVVNRTLIGDIRKKKLTPNDELNKMLKDYLDSVNDFDFISPIVDGVDVNIRKINEAISSGIIDIKYLTHNNKGTYTRTALETFFEGKYGTKGNTFTVGSTDIADMGIDNFYDFEKLAEKLLKFREIRQNVNELFEVLKTTGDKSKALASFEQRLKNIGLEFSDFGVNNIDELLVKITKFSDGNSFLDFVVKENLTKAGGSVTNNFQRLVKILKEHGIDLTLGGDEAFYVANFTKELLSGIVGKALNQVGLRGRSAYSTLESGLRHMFDKLDAKASIVKPLERQILDFITENNLSNKQPSIDIIEKDGKELSEGFLSLISKDKIKELFDRGKSKISDGIEMIFTPDNKILILVN